MSNRIRKKSKSGAEAYDDVSAIIEMWHRDLQTKDATIGKLLNYMRDFNIKPPPEQKKA